MKFADIKNIEVLASGTWKGNKEVTLTNKDLDQMVEHFKEGVIEPRLTLDHDPSYTDKVKNFLKIASLGFVSNLWREGNKLIADFKQVPDKIAELISGGMLKKRSAEFYPPDIPYIADGEKYPNVLAGVTFFGADKPAVNSLSNDFEVLMLAHSTQEPVKVTDQVGKPIALDTMETQTMAKVDLKKLISRQKSIIAKFKELNPKEAALAEQAADGADQTPDGTGADTTGDSMGAIEKLCEQLENLCEILEKALGGQEEMKGDIAEKDKEVEAVKKDNAKLMEYKAQAEKAAELSVKGEAEAYVKELEEEGKSLPKFHDMKVKDYLRFKAEGAEALALFKEDQSNRSQIINLGEIDDQTISKGKEGQSVYNSPIKFKNTDEKMAAIEKIARTEKISIGAAFDKLDKLIAEAGE